MTARFDLPRALALVAVAGVCVAALGACRRAPPPEPQGRAESQPNDTLAPPETSRDRLRQKVRARLVSDPGLDGAGSIVVLTDGDRVVLEGWVASSTERTLAEADASTVAGVASVDDRLLVRPPK